MPNILNSLSDGKHGQEGTEVKGIARRDFLKFCTVTAASLGLPLSMGQAIA
ncbi:MAG: twin-arginine translocation signal domain-containing protein, partial [Desulfobacula sp.]|nr:twin-arginine translocation signal domain-containing protein [Desulfobacula sp.]